MNLKLNKDITRGDIELKKDKLYKVVDIVHKDYIISVPMKQKDKTRRVIVLESEGELVE